VFIGEVRAAHVAETVDPLVYVDGRYLEPPVSVP
jgi:flavin reductase (DIM6/NTAB) family NADH-FMN oxidoreductase RutF